MATKAPVDKAVREEVRTKLNVNMVVEAGAGTGKTTALVSRIVEAFATGHTDADHVGVITFTEKAAAELSSRVREGLERAAAEEEDPERRAKLEGSIRSLYRARIETIHAFAANVLRERPVEAGLDPQYSVLSDLEAELSFDDNYTRWLEQVMDEDHPEIERAFNLGLNVDDLRLIAETLNRFRYLLPLAPFAAPTSVGKDLVDWLDANVPELEAIRDRCNYSEDKGLSEIEKLVDFRARVPVEATTDASLDRLCAQGLPWVALNRGAKTSWDDGEDCARQKEIIKEFRGLSESLPNALRSTALVGVIPLVEEFVVGYEAARRGEGVADFDDILIWARNLLRDNLDVRQYFQRRFNSLLVDEFQDTDPIQVEIATYLTSEGQDATDWRKLMPTQGKLFVVGDPKQSIYRFRRADIATYDQVKRFLLGDGFREITQNFRSSEPILDWVNETFNGLLEEKEGVQPANVPLKPTHKGLDIGRSPVVVIRGEDKTWNAAEVRIAEAEAIAAVLSEATRSDPWPIRDPVTGKERPASAGDVAILLPTRTGLEAYEDALADAGLPFRHEGSRDYFLREEVRDFVFLLQAIDDPMDKMSVIGALRSSAFGCSDDDLVLHLGTHGAWDYRWKKESENARVMGAFELLRSLHRLRGRVSLPELVQAALAESHLVEFALTLPDGPQAAANLLGIAEQARAFTSAGGGGPRSFTRWLAENAERQADEVDTDIAEETDDVIRLLTMHGSKGLEFPIVVMANLNTGGGSQREPIPDEEASQLHFRVGKNPNYYMTPEYEERWEEEREAQLAEQVRLLYVASTRARDHLVVPAIIGRSKPGPLLEMVDVFLPAETAHRQEVDGVWMLDANELVTPAETAPEEKRPTRKAVADARGERERWSAALISAIGEANEEIELTIASSVERSVRPMAAEASHSASALLVSEGPPLAVGDALHIVMERISLPQASDLGDVADAVCLEAGIPEHTGEVIEMANRCLATASVKRALGLATFQREVPFTVPTSSGFALGRMDLVYRDGDHTVIVDYKTDFVDADDCERHAREHFTGQVETYADAVASSTGSEFVDTILFYCRPGVEVALTKVRKSPL